MRTSNFAEARRLAGFFRIYICILIALTLAMGGMTLNTAPAQAAVVIAPAVINQTYTGPECVTFTTLPLTFTSSCTNPPMTPCPGWPNEVHWFWQASPGWPAWLHLDTATGVLTGCPDAGIAPFFYNAEIGCTSQLANGTPPGLCPAGTPCPAESTVAGTHATVAITILPAPVGAVPPCLTINPTVYPAAWEGMPYSITLTSTPAAGVGPLNWTATNLPPGLALDPNTGILSGIPAPGTCGPWTVMVTLTDTGVCPGVGCCAPVTAPLYLWVDCWANYYGMITTYYTTACDFTVNIGPGLESALTNVVIDGNLEATLPGNGSEVFTSVPCEGHLVVVDQTVQGPDPKTRYTCIGSNSKMVSDIDNVAYFDYARDVWIDTGSDPAGVAQPPGAGFYAAGANFSTTAPSPVPSNSQAGTKYIYRAWSLPDGSTNPNRDLWFIVDRAGTAMAEYDTYYLLNIVSDYPSFSDSTWELKDSTATYNVALQEVPTPNFWGIIGGVMRPMNASGTHVMTGPYTQKIEWFYDYTIPIILISVIVLLIVGLVIFLVLRRKGPGASAIPAAPVAQAPQPPAAATEAAKTTPVVAATVEKKALTEAETTDKPNFCPKCGAPVEKDATFCKNCGKKLV